tara:strand:- start:103 stop:390 length:288 start_codon:yes stop_codon:yes gene_type:complete
MTSNIPIYSIAKQLDIDSNRIILACKTLGINAKGSAKRLNEEDMEKIKNYFETGKNVSEEIFDVNKKDTSIKTRSSKLKREPKISHFPNRLIGKS